MVIPHLQTLWGCPYWTPARCLNNCLIRVCGVATAKMQTLDKCVCKWDRLFDALYSCDQKSPRLWRRPQPWNGNFGISNAFPTRWTVGRLQMKTDNVKTVDSSQPRWHIYYICVLILGNKGWKKTLPTVSHVTHRQGGGMQRVFVLLLERWNYPRFYLTQVEKIEQLCFGKRQFNIQVCSSVSGCCRNEQVPQSYM